MIDYVKRLAGPYTGAGQTTFSFGFKVYEETDIYVATALSNDEAATNLNYGDDYSVTLNDDQDAAPGGSITLKTALVDGEILVIGSDLDYTQELQLTNYTRFPPEQINEALDRLCIQIQQILEITGRALLVPATSSTTPTEMIERLLAAQQTAKQYADAAKNYKDQSQSILNQVQSYGQAAVTIAPYANYLITVSNAIDDVTTVGENIQPILTVADMEYSITTVAGLGSDLGVLADNVSVFEEVSEHSQAIQIVAADFKSAIACPNIHDFGVFGEDDIPQYTPSGGSIATVAESIEDIEITAGLNDEIAYIYQNQDIIAEAASLQPYAQYFPTVAGAVTDITVLADNMAAVKGVYAISDDLVNVSTIRTEVSAVANSIEGISEVAEHSNAMLIVAADFNSSVPCPNVHDFGIYGEDDIPSWTPTGGSISTVAGSINNVNTVAAQDENITFIIEHWSEIATAIAALNGTVLIKTNNLSDLANVATARTNLGLGTMATSNLDLGEWSEN